MSTEQQQPKAVVGHEARGLRQASACEDGQTCEELPARARWISARRQPSVLLSFDALVGEFERGTMLLLLTYSVARERSTAAGAAVVLWLIFVVLYDLVLLGLLLTDHEQRIGQTLFSALMLVSPADTYRLLNLTAFDTAGQVAG